MSEGSGILKSKIQLSKFKEISKSKRGVGRIVRLGWPDGCRLPTGDTADCQSAPPGFQPASFS
jgi:hypothetical protein